MAYCNVRILDIPYSCDFDYTYAIPCDVPVRIGSFLEVPFGNGNRAKVAVCVSLSERCDKTGLKEIKRVLSSYLFLEREMIELCFFMKDRTVCTFGDCVKCLVPTSLLTQTTDFVKPNGLQEGEVFAYLNAHLPMTLDKLEKKFDKGEIEKLLKKKQLLRYTEIVEKDKNKYETVVSLTKEGENASTQKSAKQQAVLDFLRDFSTVSSHELSQKCECDKSVLDALQKKGLITCRKKEIARLSYLDFEREEKKEFVLNDEQTVAFETLKECYHSPEPKVALLFGVTGSGKTSVMKKVIDECVENGRGVIILVPEISLTPQTVSTFCGYYKEKVAVLHSSLSVGERFDQYKRILSGEATVVIGTRSAVFAPVKNLGLIVMDEEQEHTYKSDTTPKYQTHDVAKYRVFQCKGLLLLASATPSLESFYKAMEGTYQLVKLSKRYGKAVLPSVVLTDMRNEREKGNMGAFSKDLLNQLQKTFENGCQAILFLNRRGYFNSLTCESCGKPIECPNCSVAMTYHSYRKITEEITAENAGTVLSKNGVLKCHLCGYRMNVPERCPSCETGKISSVGFGTQKTEQDLNTLFPEQKTLRLDADTTGTKEAYEKILFDFKDKKADALIGTQMVTKGHNFPSVTLVGVLNADSMIYQNDFRASERAFSMLTQVVGRAGRADEKGVAVIQTNSPNHQTILLAQSQNYEAFYQNEILIRKAYQFPPYCDIVLLTVIGERETDVCVRATEVLSFLKERIGTSIPVVAYGPFDAPVYRLNGKYRKRIVLKCKLNPAFRKILADTYSEYLKTNDGSVLSIDCNPSNL